jgi:hypothetical protein
MSVKSDFMVKIYYDGQKPIMEELCRTKKSAGNYSDSEIRRHGSKNPAIKTKSSGSNPVCECSKCFARFASRRELDLHLIENHDKLKAKVTNLL